MRFPRNALLVLAVAALGAALAYAGAAQVPPQVASSHTPLSAASPRPAPRAVSAAPAKAAPPPTSARPAIVAHAAHAAVSSTPAKAPPPAAHPKTQPAATPAANPMSAPAGPRLSPGAAIPPAELEAFVDGVVRAAMTSRHIAGVSVSVVQDGQVVLKKGYGFAGRNRPVDPDRTLFRIGSISKTFTWIAVMKAVESGRMRLDQPINSYLPEAVQVRDMGRQRQVELRDLMTHSPGFEDRALGQLFEQDPERVRPLVDYLREERPRRVRPPGQVSVYSNYGAMLAGEAAANLAGRPFEDLIEREITQPLGLDRTTFREPYPARAELPKPMPPALVPDVSTGYRWADGGYQPQRFEYVTQGAPAGAGSSTASDMARYMLMILGGGTLDKTTVYGPDTAKGFQTTLQSNAPGVNGWDNGFMEFALPGGFRGQGHGGDTLWFHSDMVLVPALNLGIFVTTNTDTGPALADTLPDRVVERFYAAPPAALRQGDPSLAAQTRVYTGTYLDDRRPYRGLQKFVLLLISQAQIAVTPDGRLITPSGDGPQAWVPAGADGRFVSVDGQQATAFQVVSGRAVRWFPPSGATTFERIGPIYQRGTLGLMTAVTLLACIATLVGLAVRDTRELRQTPTQARASLVQTTISVLWILAVVIFGLWASGASDLGHVMYDWPGPLILIASACALVAAMLTLGSAALTPVVWRGGRRLDSWTLWRKLRFTATTIVFLAFSVQLFLWGALAPWSA